MASRLTIPLLGLLVALTVLGGCSGLRPETGVSGVVLGERLLTSYAPAAAAKTTAGAKATPTATAQPLPSDVAPLKATITCNGVIAHSGADGAFHLSMSQASDYSCRITAGDDYAPQEVSLSNVSEKSVQIDFNATAVGDASCSPISAGRVQCPYLRLKPGSLAGTVTSSDTLQPLAHATITCWTPGRVLPGATKPQPVTTASDGAGAWSLDALHPGAYVCFSAGTPTLFQ